MISWERWEAGERRSETTGVSQRFGSTRETKAPDGSAGGSDVSPARCPLYSVAKSGSQRRWLRAPRSVVASWLCFCCGTVPGPHRPVLRETWPAPLLPWHPPSDRSAPLSLCCLHGPIPALCLPACSRHIPTWLLSEEDHTAALPGLLLSLHHSLFCSAIQIIHVLHQARVSSLALCSYSLSQKRWYVAESRRLGLRVT